MYEEKYIVIFLFHCSYEQLTFIILAERKNN